jgi:signal peptidase II
MSDIRTRPFLPFALTAIIIALDQASKALIVAHVERGTIGFSALGDFFWIVHERNPAIAFSIGYGLPAELRGVLFVALPILLMAAIVVYYFKAKGLSALERWALCGILGGGVGNIIDRIARPEGVVDFLSCKFYGLFGLERWPTFNVADSSVVVCGILLVIALIIEDRKAAK